MEELYILGNGFDLHHNLPTCYQAFHKYVKEHQRDLLSSLEYYFLFKTDKDYQWNNFEEDLGTFDWKGFYYNNNHLDPLAEDFRPSYVYSLEDDLAEQAEALCNHIRNAFMDWLEMIDLSVAVTNFDFPHNSQFLSFNYTLLLEHVYKIESSRILHLHGNLENHPDDLILGHNSKLEELPELDDNGDSNRTMFSNAEIAAKGLFSSFYKPVEDVIKTNSKFFESLSNVQNIHIIGHSLNQIDMPYFEQVLIHTKNPNWNVSYHLISDKQKYFKSLINLGVPSNKINLFKLNQ